MIKETDLRNLMIFALSCSNGSNFISSFQWWSEKRGQTQCQQTCWQTFQDVGRNYHHSSREKCSKIFNAGKNILRQCHSSIQKSIYFSILLQTNSKPPPTKKATPAAASEDPDVIELDDEEEIDDVEEEVRQHCDHTLKNYEFTFFLREIFFFLE